MFTEQRLVEVHSNNMANATSAGFRRSVPLRDGFNEYLGRTENRHDQLTRRIAGTGVCPD